MKVLFTTGLLFINLAVFTQVDSAGLKDMMQQLDRAMLQKDEAILRSVLHKDVSYGHSNGWVQSKTDVLNDFKSGKLVYSKIENTNATIVAINKRWATVRTNTNAEGEVNGNAFKLTLHAMQLWIKTKKSWQLIARQSSKTS